MERDSIVSRRVTPLGTVIRARPSRTPRAGWSFTFSSYPGTAAPAREAGRTAETHIRQKRIFPIYAIPLFIERTMI